MDILNCIFILLFIDFCMVKSQFHNFIVWPRNMTVNLGDNITIDCTLRGGSFYYTWEFKALKDKSNRDGTVIGFCYRGKPCVVRFWPDQVQITNNSQLFIRNISSFNSGQYFCETTSLETSELIRASAWIFVKTPPESISISFNKSQDLFQEDESILVKCFVNGSNPSPKVVIYIVANNQITPLKLVPGDQGLSNSGAVTVFGLWRPTYSEHRGFIMCTATNDAGSLTQNSSILDIMFGPKISPFKSNNISAIVNQTIDLNCLVNANPPARVQWLIDNGLRQIASSQLITKVQPEMAGNLTCVAKNPIGSVSHQLRLVVLKDPVIMIKPKYKVKEKTDASIACQVNAIPEPDFIKWYKLSSDLNEYSALISNDAKLNFINIDRSSAGKYVCVTKNTQRPSDGMPREITVKKTLELIVTYLPGEPTIKSGNEVRVRKGNQIRIKCYTNDRNPGEPLPSLSWIDADSRTTVFHSDEFLVEKATSLNNGNYQCASENELGITLSSKTVVISVNEPPIVISHEKSNVFLSYSFLPQTINFPCTFQGLPLNSVNWFHQGTRISTNQDFFITNNRTISHERARHLSSNLTIKLYSPNFSVQSSSKSPPSGIYSCESTNQFGTASYDYCLIIKYPPLIIINIHERKVAGSLGQDFVSIKCQIESIDEPQISWFRTTDRTEISTIDRKYKINTKEVTKYNPETDIFAAGVKITELRIFDLLLGDFTSYTCVATNEQGSTKGVVELVFKTKPDVPYDVKVTSIEWDSITISWRSGFNGGVEQSFDIHVYSDTFGSQNVPFYSDKIENRLTLKGLHPKTNYSVQLYAVNVIGKSGGSSTIACVTKRNKKFDSIHARILSDQPKVEIIVPDTDLCANLDYTRDNGRQWFNIQHCIKFNMSQVNVTVFLDVNQVASIYDLQTGIVRLRLTFCLLSRPGICSNHIVLENPKTENFTTQTVILIIAVICIVLILILIILFVVCCIRFKNSCHICCCCRTKYERSKIINSRLSINKRTSSKLDMLTDGRNHCSDGLDETMVTMGSPNNYCSNLINCSTPHVMNNQLPPRNPNDLYSSFTCQHQTQPSMYYEGSVFLQPPLFSFPSNLNTQSYEASSSNSHSSAGSSSRTNHPKSCLKYRSNKDSLTNNVIANQKSLLELNEKIQLPDVTSEAIHFVKSSDTTHVLEAVV